MVPNGVPKVTRRPAITEFPSDPGRAEPGMRPGPFMRSAPLGALDDDLVEAYLLGIVEHGDRAALRREVAVDQLVDREGLALERAGQPLLVAGGRQRGEGGEVHEEEQQQPGHPHQGDPGQPARPAGGGW